VGNTLCESSLLSSFSSRSGADDLSDRRPGYVDRRDRAAVASETNWSAEEKALWWKHSASMAGQYLDAVCCGEGMSVVP
jgi:hypothetical protein